MEAEYTCIRKPTMPTAWRDEGWRMPERELGREPDEPGPQQLWFLYFPTTAWPDSSACFPGELPGLVIAGDELEGKGGGKGAQPDPNSLG